MTTDKCFSCKRRKDKSLLCTICGIGINGEREYYTRKPITNADRIRAMTDEALAELLKSIRYSWTCVPRDNGNRCADFKDNCHACWLDWLKQEVE